MDRSPKIALKPFGTCYKKKEIKTMSTKEIITKIETLNEWETLLAEAQEEVNAIKDELKQIMLDKNTEELEVGQYIIRWTNVTTNRFDSANFKKQLPEIYKAFLKQSISKRFSISF